MTKSCWFVLLPCGKRFPMVGGVMSGDEALDFARGIWPNAEVE